MDGEENKELEENKNQRKSFSVNPETEEPGYSKALQSPLAFELHEKHSRSHEERRAPDTSSGNYPILVDGQQAFSPPVQQPQSQWSPTPPVIHNYGNPTNSNRQNQYKGPQGQYKNNQQQGSQGQHRGPNMFWVQAGRSYQKNLYVVASVS